MPLSGREGGRTIEAVAFASPEVEADGFLGTAGKTRRVGGWSGLGRRGGIAVDLWFFGRGLPGAGGLRRRGPLLLLGASGLVGGGVVGLLIGAGFVLDVVTLGVVGRLILYVVLIVVGVALPLGGGWRIGGEFAGGFGDASRATRR